MMSTWILLRLLLVLCTAVSVCMRVNGTEEETYALHSPSISPDGKTVIFVSDHRNGNPDIYRVGIDGKNLKRLTDGKARYSDPAWSPDGRTIALTKRDDSGEFVMLIGSDGSKPQTITKGKYDEAEPAWLPDGTKLIVTTSRNDNADLMLITSSGGEERYVAATNEAEVNPNCSRDGQRVVYEIPDFRAGTTGDKYQIHIWKKSLVEAHAPPVQLTSGSHVDSSPHFSPDGAKICFARSRDVDGIWTMDSDGTNPQRVPIDSFDAYDPSWSPDGSKIVFVRETVNLGTETTREEIYTVKPDGTGLTQITSIAPLFQASNAKPDQPVVASRPPGGKSQSNLSTASEDEVTVSVPWDSEPVWSPDGTMIAFVSTRNGPGGIPDGPDNVWLVNADGTGLRQLTTEGNRRHPTWSPDGTKVAYNSGAGIWQVVVETGEATQIAKSYRGGFDPDWHRTDATKMLCWFRTSKHDNDIVLINPQTCRTARSGHKIVVAREGDDLCPRWSPDGSRIAFIGETKDPNGGESAWHLMTMLADGTGIQTYCEVSEWAARLSWFPDSSKVLIDRGKVCQLSTQQVTDLFNEPIVEPDISRDGLRVTYADSTADGQFLFVRNIDGSGLVQITDASGGHQARVPAQGTPQVASRAGETGGQLTMRRTEAVTAACASDEKRHGNRGKLVAGGGAGIGLAAILAKMLFFKRV